MDDYNGHDDDGDDVVGVADTGCGPEQGQTRRACDICRARKVACDREEPCSTCVRGSAKCTYTAHQVLKPKRQRVLISTQYERKIDRIEDRLNQVIDLLRVMTTNPASASINQQKDILVERPRATIAANQSQQRPQQQPHKEDDSTSIPRVASAVEPMPAKYSGYSAQSASAGIRTSDSSNSPDPTFEGESSLSAHADFASRFIEEAVQSAPDQSLGGEIDETLSALRQLVGAQANCSFASVEYPNARPAENKKSRPMPPVQMVMSCLSIARHHAEVEAFWMSGFVSFDKFMQYVVDVYFAAGVTDAQYLIVNVGLYWLFTSLVAIQPDTPWPGLSEDETEEACVLCRENIETCLSELPYHLPGTLDYVLALSFAGGHALEMSRPSLAWKLITSAIHICQNLGYHRASVLEKDKPALRDQKYRIFWNLYVLEKNLSLRLGRATILQDCDISLPRPDRTQEASELWAGEGPWYMCMSYCSGMASIQGRVYTHLYCPAALQEEDSVRAERAKLLADELMELSNSQPSGRVRDFVRERVWENSWGAQGTFNFRDRALEVSKENISPTNLSLDYLVECLRIQQLCILTLIYRAMPVPKGSPSVFTPDCIGTARLSLATHQRIINSIPAHNTSLIDMYFSWTILAVPFAPFIVLFCHIIESSTSNNQYEGDLKRLEDFTASLEAGGRLSGATGRLQKLCQVLYNVARKYAELKSNANQAQSQREFDSYIHALGLFGSIPVGAMDSGPTAGLGDVPAPAMDGSGAGAGADPSAMPSFSQLAGSFPMSNDTQQQEFHEQGAMLGDWFYGGQQMLGILEQARCDFEL